jgi:hypothetical protein
MTGYAQHTDFAPQARIALYYAPPAASAWWDAGCEWLGRDPERAHSIDTPLPDRIAALGSNVEALTRAPRRYGWHGTLVAPFHCAEGVRPLDVLSAARDWARHFGRFDMPVGVAEIGRFVALRPANTGHDDIVREIAASALRAMAPLRARPSPQQIESRIAPGMSERQIGLLREWGYPYVLDEFRFHMTLSDSLGEAAARTAIASHWTERIEALGPLPFHGASLFVEPQPGAPFALWQRLPFDTAQDPA